MWYIKGWKILEYWLFVRNVSHSDSAGDCATWLRMWAHFTKVFSITIQIQWKFCCIFIPYLDMILLQFLHMSQQESCCAMCKKLMWLVDRNLRESKIKFLASLNHDGKATVKCVPGQFLQWECCPILDGTNKTYGNVWNWTCFRKVLDKLGIVCLRFLLLKLNTLLKTKFAVIF